MSVESIFRTYYAEEKLEDRFASSPRGAVDVLIPVIHTNELWEANLRSLYREVPINRLLISDGGCRDDSLKKLENYPRVTILNHQQFKTLGFCLRKLIEEVQTEWFVYVHSDVYLPSGWFERMQTHQKDYEWFGCPQRITALLEYSNIDKLGGEVRPYAGSQMGKKAAFEAGLTRIEDDYVYRQEDFVLASIVTESGFREGKVEDVFHYHQVMHKESPWGRKIRGVSLDVEWSPEERVRNSTMQVRGIIKYLKPTPGLTWECETHLTQLMQSGLLDWREFQGWVQQTNPIWLGKLNWWRIQSRRFLNPRTLLGQVRRLLKLRS